MKALITGATGFVGQRLVSKLSNSVVLSRNAASAKSKLADHQVTAFGWQPIDGPPPSEAFDGVDTVFNLAGEPVAEGRWNRTKLQRIRDSRVLGTRHLVDGIAACEQRPKTLVSASAVGYYGPRPDELLDESSTPGDGVLANICIEWEREAMRAAEFGVRVVCLRIGVVLGQGGGAMSKMLTPFKLGIGGRLGSGRQYMPWIHVDDIVGLLLHSATNELISGPMNGVAPGSVTNREFTKALGSVLRRPTLLPAPAFALRLAIGGFADILLESQQVVPRVAEKSGYRFNYPSVTEALAQVAHGDHSSSAA